MARQAARQVPLTGAPRGFLGQAHRLAYKGLGERERAIERFHRHGSPVEDGPTKPIALLPNPGRVLGGDLRLEPQTKHHLVELRVRPDGLGQELVGRDDRRPGERLGSHGASLPLPVFLILGHEIVLRLARQWEPAGAKLLLVEQPRFLERLDVGEIAQRVEAETRQEALRRELGVGRAGLGTPRARGDDVPADRLPDHLAEFAPGRSGLLYGARPTP